MEKPRLLDRVRHTIRALHYSRNTEQAYCYWIRFYIRFHRNQHPTCLDHRHVSQFLTFLAVRRNVSAATQNQALNAVLFLYNRVLEQPLQRIDHVIRAKRSRRIPVVLTRSEIRSVVDKLEQPYLLMASLMYGAGLRLMETLRLRLKDIDRERMTILVRAGKGDKDRVTVLPEDVIADIDIAAQRVAGAANAAAMRYAVPCMARRNRRAGTDGHGDVAVRGCETNNGSCVTPRHSVPSAPTSGG